MFDKKLLESAELYSRRYKNFATMVIFPVLALMIGLLIFSVFAKKEVLVTSQGDIEPSAIVAQIQSTSNSQIVVNNLQEGKNISKNDLLIKYNSIADTTTLDAIIAQEKQFEAQKIQLLILKQSVLNGNDEFQKDDGFGYESEYKAYQAQEQSVTANVNKSNQAVTDQNNTVADEQSTISAQIVTLNTQISQYQILENAVNTSGSGKVESENPFKAQLDSFNSQIKTITGTDTASTSQKQALQSQFLASIQSSINSLQEQIQSLNVQNSSLNNSNAIDTSLGSQLSELKSQELQNIDKNMTDLTSNLANINAKIGLQKQENQQGEILSNNSGILHVLPNIIGLKTIPNGTPLAQIYPTLSIKTPVKITAYIPSSQLSGIKLGQTARFTVIQTLPKPEIMEGKITHIDSAPTDQNNLNFYKVEATTTLNKSDLLNIRYGIQGKVGIIIGDKTFFNDYLDKLSGKE
ncbi:MULTISPECIES: bacteriocin secretion accessory protein [unclassified Lactococcus]|uniref:bacteriocin secretion accessory protein n=1 Tax=unclassified Lactococcus TaxID=2643510 RepID=UPI0011CB6CD7|nr:MULTISPECIES: bacteriocin secretion accessory protein [unclassified Lactococcus]MQW23341.1 bacteriocin secretion accessory protein [Lactococcus sp. dk101]TXK37957.1 bacteriocin secretion accessory protein [Lactococcus sp. dk310]TXK49611.1 bacteriocin secretion accessory protein [Lactococcus sp. dk322]